MRVLPGPALLFAFGQGCTIHTIHTIGIRTYLQIHAAQSQNDYRLSSFQRRPTRGEPIKAFDVQVDDGGTGCRQLTNVDLETAYTTQTSMPATCDGVIIDGRQTRLRGYVTPRGTFAKVWRLPLAWTDPGGPR